MQDTCIKLDMLIFNKLKTQVNPVISSEIIVAVFEYSGIAAKRLRAAKPLRHWQRGEKSLESADSGLKSFLASFEMTRCSVCFFCPALCG